MATNSITTVSGTVEQVNPNGIKLSNHDQWLNYSQYGYGGPKYPQTGNQPAPAIGASVTAQVKNDRFLHAMSIGGVPVPTTPQATQNAPAPVTAPLPTPTIATIDAAASKAKLIDIQIETRQTLLKTLAVAQPGLFADLDKLETLTEMVRNLESFVLEDLIASTQPEPEPSEEDLLDEEEI